LVGTAVDTDVRGPHDSSQAEESLHVYLVMLEEFGIIVEIAKKPAKLPQGFLSAIQACKESLFS